MLGKKWEVKLERQVGGLTDCDLEFETKEFTGSLKIGKEGGKEEGE